MISLLYAWMLVADPLIFRKTARAYEVSLKCSYSLFQAMNAHVTKRGLSRQSFF